jgi:hypothetical protein
MSETKTKHIELHEYYFAKHTGNLKGVRPGTRDTLTIQGPFIKFENQMLYTKDSIYFLPTDKTETSGFLMERTHKILLELSKKR